MKIWFLSLWKKLKQWTIHWAYTPYAPLSLFLIAFAEASVFPIPPDILLITILMINPKEWLRMASLTTLGSVLGGVIGYIIGWGFYQTIGARLVEVYQLQDSVNIVGEYFDKNVFIVVFLAALTFVIPFKVITISAGLFKVSLIEMIVASFIGRGMRYFLVAYFTKMFGRQAMNLSLRYFNLISFIILLLILAYLVVKFFV